MAIFIKAWNNFKTQPDVWFFYGFIITFTLSIRKVLFFYPIAGQFNEWTGIYLYLSDIFLALILTSWIIVILQKNKTSLSMDSVKLWLKKGIIYLPLILVIWSFASILWSGNQNIALFRAIKLLEFYFLYLYIIFRIVPHLSREIIFRRVFQIIIALGFIQALFGIWQFIIQHSIGLFYLKESLISPNIDGVAKILFHGNKFIRAYGLFPHPNILGGFLLISVILTLAYKKMFRACPVANNCSTWNNYFGTGVEHFNVSWGGTIIKTILAVQILSLILTFSKSAIIGLLIAIGYISWKNKKLFHACPVNCSLWNNFYGVEHLYRKLAILIFILIAGLYLSGLNFEDNLSKSLGDRSSQLEIWKSTISSNNFLFGSGIGIYLFHMEQTFPHLEAWQYQPIHNVYLLILSELGFVGLFMFAFFLWKILVYNINVPPQKECSTPEGMFHVEHPTGQAWNILRGKHETIIFEGILMGLIFIMLFDHYLWDIQQGQIILWMILGLLASLQLQSQLPQSNPK